MIQPRKVEFIREGDLIPLKQLTTIIRPVIAGQPITPDTVSIEVFVRQNFEGCGIFLGHNSNGFFPEVVEDEQGIYTLIFRKKL